MIPLSDPCGLSPQFRDRLIPIPAKCCRVGVDHKMKDKETLICA